jgi:hypothetical protein
MNLPSIACNFFGIGYRLLVLYVICIGIWRGEAARFVGISDSSNCFDQVSSNSALLNPVDCSHPSSPMWPLPSVRHGLWVLCGQMRTPIPAERFRIRFRVRLYFLRVFSFLEVSIDEWLQNVEVSALLICSLSADLPAMQSPTFSFEFG